MKLLRSCHHCRRWNIGLMTGLIAGLLLLSAAAWAQEATDKTATDKVAADKATTDKKAAKKEVADKKVAGKETADKKAVEKDAAEKAVFLRLKIIKPAGQEFRVELGGKRHYEPWNLKNRDFRLRSGQWSDWQDLSDMNWHGRGSRSGGVAEWPAMSILLNGGETKGGCEVQVQLADGPNEKAIVHSFTEKGAARTIRFLMPTPLREKKDEFETGTQIAQRHLEWAKEATGNQPIQFKHMDICTLLSYYDDRILSQIELQALKQLGFNVINSDDDLFSEARKLGFRLFQQEWIYEVHPERNIRLWNQFVENKLNHNLKTPEGRWKFRDGVAHWVLKDEIESHARFYKDDPYDGWFRQYLRDRGVTDALMGQPIDQIKYPTAAMQNDAPVLLDDKADLKARKLFYYATQYAHWQSAKSLRGATDLVHGMLPKSKTETLPTSHGFWESGMDRQFMDFFEIGRQQAVDQLSAEDWLGLNHMYGPNMTFTGAQTLEYLCAVMRSGIQDHDMLLRVLITPSDDQYLQLKAFSALSQGAKSFFYWAYGPTIYATENYWSDLRSMYDGIGKVNRSLVQVEKEVAESKLARDPVAVLYSVSNDVWGAKELAAARVEKRLLFHGLRHLSAQPDFLDEEMVAEGRLKDYKVLYVTDWCIRRDASTEIDQWVKNGGILYMSSGAATRDEFYEPYLPSFAQAIWPANVTKTIVNNRSPRNERRDLATTPIITTVKLKNGFSMPVLGCKSALRNDLPANAIHAKYADGSPAGVTIRYGKGQIVGLGFMPMLAYGRLANFKPETLEEKGPAEPRELIREPLNMAKVKPVAQANVPVVVTGLLNGGNLGSVVVLANYTYQPIDKLSVDVTIAGPI
ncbi:MAG: hypothetical protein FWC56_03910, partial [Phycisphaerae bacterium]|nr:hypothetical protein [Phycisphaerae bacterium]